MPTVKRLPMTKAALDTSGVQPGTELDARQFNQYDKILRENIESALPGLIKNLLGIHAEHSEELPDDVQHTKERKPDVLKKITDKNGETFVLHIEFQVTDEREMVFRMAEYYIMLLRRYKLPVRQYVIYLGEGRPHMPDHILSEQMHFKYQIITLSAIDYHLLLCADNPEGKMLAILGNLGDSDPRQVVGTIVNEVITASKGDFSKQRHIQQLRILSKLRNLELENVAIMDSIAEIILNRKEKDPFYIMGQREGREEGREKGREEGMEKKSHEFVQYLLLNTNHTIPEIARLVKVSEDFVRQIKESL